MAEKEKIKWSINVQIANGPSLALAGEIPVDAYDKIGMTIENGANEKEVDVQPADTEDLKFLLIKSSKYDDPSSSKIKLVYKVNGSQLRVCAYIINGQCETACFSFLARHWNALVSEIPTWVECMHSFILSDYP